MRERVAPGNRRQRRTPGVAWARKAGATLAALAVMGSGGLVHGDVAQAATVYEIEGQWQAPVPAAVVSGDTVVSEWRFNINDDSPAPTNDPVDNVTVTFTTQNAMFTELPSTCLTEGVDPVSEISADGRTLVCNLGTRDQGTAELMLTGMEAEGLTGDAITISGSIGGASADLDEVPIINTFAMDMKFDEGAPTTERADPYQNLSFPWSLRHSRGAAAGPASVSYDLRFTSTGPDTIIPQATGCTAQDLVQPGHPYSGAGYAAEQTAPFPATCTLISTGTNRMRLTLTGIDYSKTLAPRLDSTGTALPSAWDVVASGLVNVRFVYDSGNTVTMTATSLQSYTSASGEVSTDDDTNNVNSRSSTRGVWSGGWNLSLQSPPVEGTAWTDTFRTMAGQPALAGSGVRPPNLGATTSTQVCTVVDSRYVDVVEATMGTISEGVVTPYAGIQYRYYTGNGVANSLNPSHANYNPNDFQCDGTTGWSATKPADMSTVRAIKAIISPAAGANIAESVARNYIETRIKDGVAVGQDIWTWTSYSLNGGSTWFNPTRSMDPGDAPAFGVLTPNSRYPFTAGGRDVLRIIAAVPTIQKVVDQRETIPGATVNYTLTYRAEAPTDATIDEMSVQDVLPDGMEYVVGSASPAPTSVSGQTIDWVVTSVPTNTDQVITFSARVPADADAGESFDNTATATVAGATAEASASTLIRDGGYTMLTKTAAEAKVPHDNGTAEDSWTVRISSRDTRPQTFTDTVDVLPYNGDGRGTSFTGQYVLSAPVDAVAGATVYYTTADPGTLVDDPADPSNGSAGDVAGNTVGWSTTFDENATAVRVIGPALAPSASQEFTIAVVTTGATFEDVYVNRAEARSDRTELVMRTSSRFEIGAVNSVTLKKYVQDSEGEWRDANDVDDYPQFHTGATLAYRLVVTNTGDQTLQDLLVTDDRVELAALDPLPVGLAAGATIPELLPGADNAVTIDYQVDLTERPEGAYLVNTACVAPEDTTAPEPGAPAPVEEACDPAGIEVLPSSLTWEKVSVENGTRLEGAEWELTPVDGADAPTGDPIAVVDCVASEASDCTGEDVNPAAGLITVDPLDDGRYRLVETRAPAGYQLDSTPRFIDVQGETVLSEAIENELFEGPSIPLTGGLGSLGFWVGSGALIMLMTAGLLWQRRRRVLS
ncbi:SpaA isopeptide-forming pilin-related protein [Microbacterium paraoxydans]|uniref:SpaA isopeptide-forming pilin-related protein n=1 Tax=Microbacterium paraoxydans TaxID=199592 RepID=UPI001CFB436A|nr:SpaA isopeptide-forming pilin-related protein [Microbacterium paraoxydans]